MSDNTKKLAFECAKLQKKVNDFTNELEEKKKILKNIMKNDVLKQLKVRTIVLLKPLIKVNTVVH